MTFLESGAGIAYGLRDLPKHLNLLTVSHGFVGWVFSITGPMLILLSVAEQGNLPEDITVSWIFIGLLSAELPAGSFRSTIANR